MEVKVGGGVLSESVSPSLTVPCPPSPSLTPHPARNGAEGKSARSRRIYLDSPKIPIQISGRSLFLLIPRVYQSKPHINRRPESKPSDWSTPGTRVLRLPQMLY